MRNRVTRLLAAVLSCLMAGAALIAGSVWVILRPSADAAYLDRVVCADHLLTALTCLMGLVLVSLTVYLLARRRRSTRC